MKCKDTKFTCVRISKSGTKSDILPVGVRGSTGFSGSKIRGEDAINNQEESESFYKTESVNFYLPVPIVNGLKRRG